MKNLNIAVVNDVATYQKRDGFIVCGNTDYTVTFAFDSEWGDEKYYSKTARFKWNGVVHDVPFQGNVVKVPKITNATQVEVGVYSSSGDLEVTTPAIIPCVKSILCEDGMPDDPSPDVYSQILEKLNDGVLSGPAGKNGKDGKDGKDGVDGKSAYELYKQAHPEYTGTLEEWLDSLSTYTKQILTTNNEVMRFFLGDEDEYNNLTEAEKDNLFAVLSNDDSAVVFDDLKKSVYTEDLDYELSSDGLFYICKGLKEEATEVDIVVPISHMGKPVTEIGEGAFQDTGIKSVKLPNSIVSVGRHAFSGCEELSNIMLPNNCTKIGAYAFSGCKALRNIYIPYGVEDVGIYLFTGCSNLTVLCEASEAGKNWSDSWNAEKCPVVWGAVAPNEFNVFHASTADTAKKAMKVCRLTDASGFLAASPYIKYFPIDIAIANSTIVGVAGEIRWFNPLTNESETTQFSTLLCGDTSVEYTVSIPYDAYVLKIKFSFSAVAGSFTITDMRVHYVIYKVTEGDETPNAYRNELAVTNISKLTHLSIYYEG